MAIWDSKVEVGLNLDKIGEDVTGVLDAPTKRLATDLTSVFKLPHLIRPITAIWAAVMYTILSLMSLWLAYGTPDFGLTVSLLFGSISGILITIIGFYFKGRKQEKIDMKKMQAAVEIKKMELESKIELEEMKSDSDLDDDKLERKIKNRESRRKGKFRLFGVN